jgi:hypothetical protein
MAELAKDLLCRHQRLKSSGYHVMERVFIYEWECPDCGFFGDSTVLSASWEATQQAWREYLIDGWVDGRTFVATSV